LHKEETLVQKWGNLELESGGGEPEHTSGVSCAWFRLQTWGG